MTEETKRLRELGKSIIDEIVDNFKPEEQKDFCKNCKNKKSCKKVS